MFHLSFGDYRRGGLLGVFLLRFYRLRIAGAVCNGTQPLELFLQTTYGHDQGLSRGFERGVLNCSGERREKTKHKFKLEMVEDVTFYINQENMQSRVAPPTFIGQDGGGSSMVQRGH